MLLLLFGDDEQSEEWTEVSKETDIWVERSEESEAWVEVD